MAETRIYGYIRVSTKEQHIERQIDSLRQHVPDERNLIVDKCSGKDFDRPQYKAMLRMLRDGDTLFIHDLDRLGRNKAEIMEQMKFIRDMGVSIKILDLPTTMMDYSAYGDIQKSIMEMVNNVLLEVLSTMSENELRIKRKRQAEGIAAARARGKHLGRQWVQAPENWPAVYELWKAKKITAKAAMAETGLKRTTFYRIAREYAQKAAE